MVPFCLNGGNKMKYLLECKNISKSYKRKKSKVAVLNSICCSFEKKNCMPLWEKAEQVKVP